MKRFVLASGLLRRGESVLLVRCRYGGEPEPLWTLPGGRQEAGESLADTVRREFREETSLEITPGDLAYVSESIDSETAVHVLNTTFWVVEKDLTRAPRPADDVIVEALFVPAHAAGELLRADVLRIPVSAALSGRLGQRYFFFRAEDITIPFFTSRRKRAGERGSSG